jgi:23S rRNA (cytosine1962-C5)-methyltransferase
VSELAEVVVNARGARRLRSGHVWVFDSDVRDAGGAEDGAVVRVVSRHRSGGSNALGVAFYNSVSMIRLRLIARRTVEPDRDFWRERLLAALSLRRLLGRDGPADTAGRLVYAEADGIPGLIVDHYGGVLVLQTLSAGAERLLETWLSLLAELVAPRAIVERNDTHSRRLEGLPTRAGVLRGELPEPLQVADGGLTLTIDPLQGQKTGAFLDQRENRQRAAAYAGGRCLDVFCYQGGFGLQLARGGADEVTLVDQSAPALQAAAATAAANGLTVHTRAANGFDFLREHQAAGERYRVVVLDPPAFAKNKAAVERAARGYKEINLRAIKLLEPGGILISSSCSYHMQAEHFERLLLDAGRDAGRSLQVLERRSQARDHPERLGFPESRYLKCLVLRAL